MALTQAQWYDKLKSWVAGWFFEKEQYNRAIFKAMAAVFAQCQLEAESQRNQTFIAESTSPILDVHGGERSMVRLTNETDLSYANRVRNFANQADKASLTNLINSLLNTGTCQILEGFQDGFFVNRLACVGRQTILNGEYYDAFTVIIPPQQAPLTASYAFVTRLNFSNRLSFIGRSTNVAPIYEAVVQAINDAKAFGVLYKIVES